MEFLESRLALVRWYVDASASGANTGEDWNNALVSLQEALLLALPTDEIWVANGTYRPTDTNDRTISFELLDGMGVYGGFAGFETELEERNIADNPTILSGDIGEQGDTTDNSYHVVRIRSESLEGELNGFTITGGNANGDFGDYNRGGGLFNHGMYTIANCRIIGNSAEEGGGVYTSSNGLDIINSEISGNVARGIGGGGGISADGSVYGPGDVNLTDVRLTGNSAISGNGGGLSSNGRANLIRVTAIENSATEERGGGVFNSHIMNITDSMFQENMALEDDGGAVYNGSLMMIIGSSFTGNVAGDKGGAISNSGFSLTVLNSTIDQNLARHGGGIHNFGTAVIGGSTISRNVTTDAAGGVGGGIFNEQGGTTFTNGTISTNTAASGGGVYSSGSGLVFDHATIVLNISTVALSGGIATSTHGTWLLNSLVAVNTRIADEGPVADDIGGNLDQNSEFNLVGAGDNAVGIAHGVNDNQVGSAAVPIAPMLGPLANNGGPAMTHLLLEGSPAIDAGDPMFSLGDGNPPVVSDQRGLQRVVDGDGSGGPRIDIGSVEAPEVASPPILGDMNGDGRIGLRDLVLLRNNLGLSGPALTQQQGDFNEDSVVDMADMAIFITLYGGTRPAPSPAAISDQGRESRGQGSGVAAREQGSGVRGQEEQGSGVRGQEEQGSGVWGQGVPEIAARRTVVRHLTASGVDRVMSRHAADAPRPAVLRASRARVPRNSTCHFAQ
jgi:hypothetical protein